MARTSRLAVRIADLDRLQRWATAHDLKPLAAEAMPGGSVRLYFVEPTSTVTADLQALEKAGAAWDAALA